jgi:hypothetical protein
MGAFWLGVRLLIELARCLAIDRLSAGCSRTR